MALVLLTTGLRFVRKNCESLLKRGGLTFNESEITRLIFTDEKRTSFVLAGTKALINFNDVGTRAVGV